MAYTPEQIAAAQAAMPDSIPASNPGAPALLPTAPAPSTINSPSASSTTAKSEWDDDSTPSAGMPTAPMAPGIDKSPVGTDINSTLAAHTNILQQILLASENNVSVNKDILKYARNST